MYANVPSPSCSSVASPAAVREAVAVRLGQRAEGQGQRGISGHVVDALALLLCWSFSVAGGPIMIMRITWGKLRAGTWTEYEQAYHATVAGKEVPGLRGRWLAQDVNDPDGGFAVS
jgi:hypothetical protein